MATRQGNKTRRQGNKAWKRGEATSSYIGLNLFIYFILYSYYLLLVSIRKATVRFAGRARYRMLVLLIGSVATSLTIRNFTSRAALLTARDTWCANRTDGVTAFGPIEDWDVSRVRDLSYLFCAKAMSGCNPNCSSFNEAIGSWDMTRVTSLEVREARMCSPCLRHPPRCQTSDDLVPVTPHVRRASSGALARSTSLSTVGRSRVLRSWQMPSTRQAPSGSP